MKKPLLIRKLAANQAGAVLVYVVLIMIIFLAFTALAVDIAHLYVVKNELQNAADAGALAGARRLFNLDGSINVLANDYAYDAAVANMSEGVAVDVNYTRGTGSNGGDIQRGHWSFGTRTFTANSAGTQKENWWRIPTSSLDSDPGFINAVKVTTRRETPQATSFFARVLGFMGFTVSAEAVAYIGFAGSILPEELDQPIAICKQSVTDANGNDIDCNIGRMSNSGSNAATHNTSAWTNYTLDCTTANKTNVVPLVCREPGSNPWTIPFGASIGSTGGEIDPISSAVRSCFNPKNRTDPWDLVLPVIDCPNNNPGNCSQVLGAIKLSVVWVSDRDADTDKEFEKEDFPPARMGDWVCPSSCAGSRVCCWQNFVSYFNLKNVDGAPAVYAKRSIYFRPSCSRAEPRGISGGKNFGILAKIPVLVN